MKDVNDKVTAEMTVGEVHPIVIRLQHFYEIKSQRKLERNEQSEVQGLIHTIKENLITEML